MVGAAYSAPSRKVASLVVPGLNTLYLYVKDTGGPAGLQFSADIEIQGTVVPEPSSLMIAITGLIMLIPLRWRRLKAEPIRVD